MSLDVGKLNTLWQRALKKSAQRDSHHPKSERGPRWSVPLRDKSIEPTSGRKRERILS